MAIKVVGVSDKWDLVSAIPNLIFSLPPNCLYTAPSSFGLLVNSGLIEMQDHSLHGPTEDHCRPLQSPHDGQELLQKLDILFLPGQRCQRTLHGSILQETRALSSTFYGGRARKVTRRDAC